MYLKIVLLTAVMLIRFFPAAVAQPDKMVPLLPNEYWWGGAVEFGDKMPFSKKAFYFDLNGDKSTNQSAALLLSNKGRWIWSEEPFAYRFQNDSLIISEAQGLLYSGKAGNSLREAYSFVSKKYFPSSGKWPDSLLVQAPQYNLWIELLDKPTQEGVMNYARSLLAYHYPPGVLMIDNRWEPYHGAFEFDLNTFPAPKQMIDSLHKMGFKVMLWVCPFISPDSKTYKYASLKKYLLLDNEGNFKRSWENISKPLLIPWWDGFSACLDLSNPASKQWLQSRLDYLQNTFGIDGFKFDAGDPYFYDTKQLVSYKEILPTEHCRLWGEIGLQYPLNEYRAMWKMGGKSLVQRLSDKNHNWQDLQKLIPSTIAQQLLGYTFTCPDMIGGGQAVTFNEKTKVDQKLFVRSTQCHALMPMMQFSAAPWRVLDKEHQQAVKKAVDLRLRYLPYILKTLNNAASSGIPAFKPLAFDFPNQGYEMIKDQFLLGDDLMIAPVVTAENKREVVFPKGKWTYQNQVIKGPTKKVFEVALEELLIFEKKK